MESSDHREFSRVAIAIRAEARGGGQCIVSTASHRLSLKGMLLVCGERLPEGTDCTITLHLGDGGLQIQAEGRVVRAYPEGLAFQFTRILGLESYEHLRKLLLYNAPDPEVVEGEFETSLGIHRIPHPAGA
jgi:hypothetical protein